MTCLKFFAWYRLKNYFQTIHKVNSNLLNISFTFRSSISLQNASTADFVIGLERATCRFMMVRIIWLMLYAYFTPWRCKHKLPNTKYGTRNTKYSNIQHKTRIIGEIVTPFSLSFSYQESPASTNVLSINHPV